MSSDVAIETALAAVAATMNDQKVESFDTDHVQDIVTESLGGQQELTVDHGGGLHDSSGARVGVVRRTPSGEWITERQNEAAERSDTAIPAAEQPSKAKSLLGKLKPGG